MNADIAPLAETVRRATSDAEVIQAVGRVQAAVTGKIEVRYGRRLEAVPRPK
jgi:hypothetical protein